MERIESDGEDGDDDEVDEEDEKFSRLQAKSFQANSSSEFPSIQAPKNGKKPKKEVHPEEMALQDAMRERWYIIPKRGRFREYWDYVVMVLAVYNCIWTPLTISFDWAIYENTDNAFLQGFDIIVLVLYSIDIVIQFLTSYYNVTTGDEI